MAFVAVRRLEELAPEQPERVEVEGVPICLVRTGDEVHALYDVCSHEEYPLHEGVVFDGCIECALHGSMFDLTDGRPRSLPATAPVAVFATEVRDGVVYVDPETVTNDAPRPH